MGCSTSKRAGLDLWSEPTPLARSRSMPGRARKKTDANYHVVALTSTTLGSLKLDRHHRHLNGTHDEPGEEKAHHEAEELKEGEELKRRTLRRRHSDLSLEVFQAKAWSSMMEGKIPIIPRTPVLLPPPPLPRLPEMEEEMAVPEIINAWELMEGLEDSSLFVIPSVNERSERSFSCSGPSDSCQTVRMVEVLTRHAASPESENGSLREVDVGSRSPETSWHQISPEDSVLSDSESEAESGSVVFPAPENGSASPEPMTHQRSQEEPQVEQPDCTDELGKPVVSPSPENRSDLLEPLWHQMKLEDSLSSDFDIEIISDFRKAFDKFSPCPESPFVPPEFELFKLEEPTTEQKLEEYTVKRPEAESEKPRLESNESPLISGQINSRTGIVKARVTQFQEKIDAKKVKPLKPSKCPPDSEDKVVLYFTSLRGVRKTYDDCCRVRLILKGFSVRIDDRDVSMHQRFRGELDEIFGGERWTLPRLFARGKHVGGAEEVRRLHETGELEKMLDGCPMVEEGTAPCEACGDVRFINCETCSGSCKVYREEEGVGVFERCLDCNENGIVRCPVCCV